MKSRIADSLTVMYLLVANGGKLAMPDQVVNVTGLVTQKLTRVPNIVDLFGGLTVFSCNAQAAAQAPPCLIQNRDQRFARARGRILLFVSC